MKFLFFLLIFVVIFKSEPGAQNTIFDQSPKTIQTLKINTSQSEFGSAIIDGKLYFSSLHKSSLKKKQNNPYFQLYSIPLNEAEINNNIAFAVDSINANFHTGPISYCPSTEELFITQTDSLHSETKKGFVTKKYIRLGIFIYQQQNGKWKFKSEFPFNSNLFSVGHPAINKTGDTLIFVSDQKGGFGKTDLYYSVRKDTVWSAPKNMGSVINTKKNEMTPFINTDGKLFFASDAHKSYGGLDMFWTQKKFNNYIPPQNMGKQYNTKLDECGLNIHPNQMLAYFTSNRNTKKKNDNIYRIKTNNYDFELISLDDAKIQIEKLKTEINQELSSKIEDLKSKKIIAENVRCFVDFKIIEQDQLPDLKITYSYELLTDTLRLGMNTYKIGKYFPEESNVVTALLGSIKTNVNGKLQAYFTPNKKIKLAISNTSDIFPFNEENSYNGEFGDTVKAVCKHNDLQKTFQFTRNSKISDEELTFLRIYGMKNYLFSNIDALHLTQNTFECEIIMGDQIKKNQKWVSIELNIKNAFGNF